MRTCYSFHKYRLHGFPILHQFCNKNAQSIQDVLAGETLSQSFSVISLCSINIFISEFLDLFRPNSNLVKEKFKFDETGTEQVQNDFRYLQNLQSIGYFGWVLKIFGIEILNPGPWPHYPGLIPPKTWVGERLGCSALTGVRYECIVELHQENNPQQLMSRLDSTCYHPSISSTPAPNNSCHYQDCIKYELDKFLALRTLT
jgi:hypothetical protein